MDEHTMSIFLQQQQLSANTDTANPLSQQQPQHINTNFSAAAMMPNNMSAAGAGVGGAAASGSAGDGMGLGLFTQNDRITPPLPLPHAAQHGHLQQLQSQSQQQQQQQRQLLLQMSSSSTTNPLPSTATTSNNLFAGIEPAQMTHLPRSSQNTILQRQYQATADRIAEEHKARAIQLAGQQVSGVGAGAGAPQFLQSLQNDTLTMQGLQQQQQQLNVDNDSINNNGAQGDVDADMNAEVDASDPLMASLQMYSQYGEDSAPLATNVGAGSNVVSGISNGNGNGYLQTNNNNNNNMYGNGSGSDANVHNNNNGILVGNVGNSEGVDEKLRQLQNIQAQLSQLQRMEREMKQQAAAQEKQLQQQRQLQQQQQQQQSAGQSTPPSNNSNGESSGGATPLSPPSLPVGPAEADAAAEGIRARVQQYEAAARSMLLQENKRRRSKIDVSAAKSAAASAATTSSSTADAISNRSRADAPSAAIIAQSAVASATSVPSPHDRHPGQQQQRRRSSVVSDGSSSTGDVTGRKRRSSDRSWRDVMKDDANVQECRARMRRRVEHYVANCMLSDKAPAAAASNAPFRRVLASKLEERLYGAAPTFEQYSDSTTLEARLKILAMQIGKRIEGEPGKRKRRRMAETTTASRSACAKTTGGGDDEGDSGGNSVASVVEDDTNKLKSLRDYVGEDKYADIVQIVEEIRTIRRTSDVWMSSDSANRRPGTTCNSRPRQAFPASGLEAASAIVGDSNGTSRVGTDTISPTGEKKSTNTEETKENSAADEGIEATPTADRKVNIIRPGSPDELSAVESMPRALTNIYFSTRLVAALTALGPSHHGSSAQVEGVDWDRLLAEAQTNLKAFRVLEESTAGSDRQSFVEVCTLSGNCRLERVDS